MYKNYEDKLNTILSNAKGERVKKYSFKDIKTLDKLTAQLRSATDKLDVTKIRAEVNTFNKVAQNLEQAKKELDQAENSYRASKEKIKKAEQDFVKEEKSYLKVDKKHDTALKKNESAAQKVFKLTDKYDASYKKGESIADKLEDAIFDVKESAKKLGVTINVSKYESAVSDFYKNDRDVLAKMNMNY
jgi:uncharacterized protein (DUF3084 family)